MFLLHFFTFPDWWIDGIEYPFFEKYAGYLAQPLNMCVPVFSFLTGYTYVFARQKNYKYSVKKIVDFLIRYWVVYLAFAAFAVVFAQYKYTVEGFVKELFALDRPTMYFCWYVYFYYTSMLLLPYVVKLLGKNIHSDLIISLVVIPYVLWWVFGKLDDSTVRELIRAVANYFPIMLVGFIFGNYALFDKVKPIFSNKVLRGIFFIVLMLLACAGRQIMPSIKIYFMEIPLLHIDLIHAISMDCIWTPMFIYAIVMLQRLWSNQAVCFPIRILGKYSATMWFVHCIFFNNSKEITQRILYFPHSPILVTVWGLLLCLVMSIGFNFVAEIILKKKNAVLKF